MKFMDLMETHVLFGCLPDLQGQGERIREEPRVLIYGRNSCMQIRRPPREEGSRRILFIGMPGDGSKFLEAGYIQHLPVLGVDLLEIIEI